LPIHDKQGHPRTRGRIRVRFGKDKPDRLAFTNNVSLTGAFVRTNNVFPPGATIKIEFQHDGREVTLYAKVVWAKKVPPALAHTLHCGMGVRFVNPGPEWIELFDAWNRGKHGAG